MSALLTYSLITSPANAPRLAIDIPNQTWEQVQADEGRAKDAELLLRKRLGTAVLEPGDGQVRLIVNDKRIGNSSLKPRLLFGIVQLIDSLETKTDEAAQDPAFRVQMSPRSINNTGRHMIDMQLLWPEAEDTALQQIVSDTMVATALNLKYESKRYVSNTVYAHVRRQSGVTLETNPLGSCSVGTDGMWYEPDDPRLELQAHNIYNHMQQFILLAGGVALARGDSLATG